MKVWISIALVAGFALVAALGSLVVRELSDEDPVRLEISGDQARRGLQVVTEQGCTACHSLDGSRGIGPTWRGLFGSTRTFKDGTTAVADADYIRESLLDPGARVVAGYDNLMVRYALGEEDMAAFVALLRQLSDDGQLANDEQ